MDGDHLTSELLRRAAAGEVPLRALFDLLLAHLTAECPACAAALGADGGAGAAAGAGEAAPDDYRAAFDSAWAALGSRALVPGSPAAAAARLDRLVEVPPAEQPRRLDEEGGVDLALWQEAIDRSLARGLGPGHGGEDLARLALAVAQRLSPAVYGAGLPRDCEAVSWVVVAAALLLRHDYEATRQALDRAEGAAAAGSGDPCVLGEIHAGRAHLATSQGRLRESLLYLSRAAGLYREAEEQHLLGETLLRQGLVLRRLGESRRARAAIGAGLLLFDGRQDQGLVSEAGAALLELLDEPERDGGGDPEATPKPN